MAGKNPKSFDKLTILSQVEGQIRNKRLPRCADGLCFGHLVFWHCFGFRIWSDHSQIPEPL